MTDFISNSLGVDFTNGTTLIELEEDDKPVSMDERTRSIDRSNRQLEKISLYAFEAGVRLLDESATTDPKHKARLAEVAATLMSAAVNAIKQKQDVEMKIVKPHLPETVNAMQVNATFKDRNELIAMIHELQKEEDDK